MQARLSHKAAFKLKPIVRYMPYRILEKPPRQGGYSYMLQITVAILWPLSQELALLS